MKQYVMLILSLFLYATSAWAENLTLTTYYPAPYGAYDRLRLVPRTSSLTGACDIGTVYADPSGDLQYCYNNSGNGVWGPLGGGPWMQNGDNVYTKDLSNSNLRVGIGTDLPDARLEVRGNGHQDITISNPEVPTRMSIGAGNNTPFLEFHGSVFHLLYQSNYAQGGDGNGTSYMAVRDNGNVGLGISWPTQAHLEIQGTGHQGIVVTSTSAANRVSIGAGNTNPYIEFNDDKPFQILSSPYSEVGLGNGPRVFVAEGDGDIGMGTDTPQAKLHIQKGTGITALRIQETSGTNAVWELRAHNDGVPDTNFSNDFSIWGGAAGSEGYRMVFKQNGNVGLGTTKPQEKFQIGSMFTFHDGGYKLMSRNTYYGGAPADDRRIFNDEVAALGFTDTGDIIFRTAPAGAPDSLIQGGTWWTPPFFIKNNGKIGVATTNPSVQFEIATGDLSVTNGCVKAAGNFIGGTCASDEILKHDILPLNNALQKVSQLRPVEFRYNDPSNGQGPQYGFVAQEVEKVFPEWVVTQDGHKSIKYGMQIQMEMLQAIKELKQENDELKERIKALEDAVK